MNTDAQCAPTPTTFDGSGEAAEWLQRADAHFTADSGVRRDALRRRGHGRAYDQERHHDDQERHKDRHEWSQNGSDAIQRRHSHRSLYTWNPLFMPLVSRAEQNIERVRKLLTI